MVLIDTLYLAVLTRNIEDADSDSTLNLTINIDGSDVVDYNPGNPTGVGEAHMYGPMQLTGLTLPLIPDKVDPFESTMLTNSSVRLGIRDYDGWRPEHILVLGGDERQVLALAAELDIDRDFPLTTEPDLSTYHAIGNLSMPIRRVGYGSSITLIRRVLLSSGRTGAKMMERTTPSCFRSLLEALSFCIRKSMTPRSLTLNEVLSIGTVRIRLRFPSPAATWCQMAE